MCNVCKDANVIGKLLALDAHLRAVWGGEVAAEVAGAPEEGVVALDFPAFNCGGIDSETPYVAQEQDAEREEGDAVRGEGGEEMCELDE